MEGVKDGVGVTDGVTKLVGVTDGVGWQQSLHVRFTPTIWYPPCNFGVVVGTEVICPSQCSINK
jgi:hypothetical protein